MRSVIVNGFRGIMVIQIFFTSLLLSAELVDRLVVEIEHRTFSQRQMEAYLGVKFLLKGQRPPERNKSTWPALLTEYTEDMLIFFESSRLGGYSPSTEMQKSASMILEANQAKFSYGLPKDSPISVALEVESYRRSKNELSKGTTNWIDDLRTRYVTRYFKGAIEYQHIQD